MHTTGLEAEVWLLSLMRSVLFWETVLPLDLPQPVPQ